MGRPTFAAFDHADVLLGNVPHCLGKAAEGPPSSRALAAESRPERLGSLAISVKAQSNARNARFCVHLIVEQGRRLPNETEVVLLFVAMLLWSDQDGVIEGSHEGAARAEKGTS